MQVIDAIKEDFSLFYLHMEMSYKCAEFAYDVSCTIGNYLNACVNAQATVSLTDPGGRILVSFKYLRDEFSHGSYMVCPPPPLPRYTPPHPRDQEVGGV